MSLFGSIQLANNALRAQQIGLQVVGQNIANANTPGYIREEVVLSPAPTQRVGNLLLGLGVEVEAIVQKIDKFLEERLRGAESDRSSSETQEEVYLQLEAIIGELSDTDLSTSLNNFFNTINDVANQIDDVGIRNLAVLQGRRLADDVARLANRVDQIRSDLNDRVIDTADEINTLLEEVRTLNIRITQTEGGSTNASDAVGLRDQRGLALSKLAQLIEIRTEEQPSGAVNIFSGGDFLVFEGISRVVSINLETDRGLSIADLRIEETNASLESSGGELTGLTVSRDTILGGFLDNLDSFAATFIFEFNQLHTGGQGLSGFQSLTSEFPVDDATLALDATGLEFTPVNGSFQVELFNKQTGLVSGTTNILVNLDGLGTDTSLNDLAAALSAVGGITATVSSTGRLTINSDSPDQDIFFSDDTSGVLAALGLNTFFSGSTARDISVNQVLVKDPAKFAAQGARIGGEGREANGNALNMAGFMDLQLESASGATLTVLYSRLTAEVTQGSSVARAVADGFRVFEETLRGQQLGVSGVSLDEEAVRMISFQRAFQASARYISTLSELLELLVNI